MTELIKNEEQIENLNTSFPAEVRNHEFNKDQFQISKSTKSTCIEFLKENDIDIENWISGAKENSHVKKVIKIWFTMNARLNKFDYCQLPTILDDSLFFENAEKVLISECEMMGMYLDH